jgi:hypothetical protein
MLVVAALLAAVGCDRNHQPEQPGAPRGPEFALPHINYLFNVRTDDLDGDSVSFRFDWGDGHTSDWSGPVRTDSLVMVAHTWEDTGRCLVRVQARDEHLSLSAWSDQSAVSVREGQVAPDFALPYADG